MTQTRSTQEVFEDHLHLREQHQLEEDIARNYADDVVLLTLEGIFHGHDGVRQTGANLQSFLPHGRYDYLTRQVYGEYAYLEWRGVSDKAEVRYGADGFVIRDGHIVAQMIHYHVQHND